MSELPDNDQVVAAPLDLANTGRLTRRDLEVIHGLHERATRTLTSNVSASLRYGIQFQFAEMEQQPFPSVAAQLDESGCQFLLQSAAGRGLMAFSAPVAYAFLEVILGGKPSDPGAYRSLTDVEIALLADVADLIRRDWESTWQTYVPIHLTLDIHETPTRQKLETIFASEMLLVVAIRVTIDEVSGELHLILPARWVSDLKRAEENSRKAGRQRIAPAEQSSIAGHLMNCLVSVQARLDAGQGRFSELLRLKAGDVLTLDARLDQPVTGLVNDVPKFHGEIVEIGSKRGLLIGKGGV